MASADETGAPAREQHRPGEREGGARVVGQPARIRGRKELGPLGKRGVVLLDVGLDGLRRPQPVAQRRARMRLPHRQGEPVNDRIGNAAAFGHPVERHGLVEAAHVRRPFDDLALPAEPERCAHADDRQRFEIDARRVVAIDGDLGLAGQAALLQRREIHERKPHRPLDLVDIGAGEKDRRIGGVDPSRPAVKPIRARVGEQAKDRVLRMRLVNQSL